jgi:hypothetical protein
MAGIAGFVPWPHEPPAQERPGRQRLIIPAA